MEQRSVFSKATVKQLSKISLLSFLGGKQYQWHSWKSFRLFWPARTYLVSKFGSNSFESVNMYFIIIQRIPVVMLSTGLLPGAVATHTPRWDISVFCPRVHKGGSWVVAHKSLAP